MKNKNSSSVRSLLRSTRGANMVEYIILVGLVALLCIGGYSVFGKNANDKIHLQAKTVGDVNGVAGN
jgi:pilus assembly protein Flp/PilA